MNYHKESDEIREHPLAPFRKLVLLVAVRGIVGAFVLSLNISRVWVDIFLIQRLV